MYVVAVRNAKYAIMVHSPIVTTIYYARNVGIIIMWIAIIHLFHLWSSTHIGNVRIALNADYVKVTK